MINIDKLVTIQPGKIIIRSERLVKESYCTRFFNKKIAKWELSQSAVNLSKKKSSFKTSDNTRRLIKQSILSLFYLSKPRTIKVSAQKFIYNFRCSFVTLTLPSKQCHSDVELKSLLGLFLQDLRNRGLKNYVWKAELQKNENIHFHLVFDKFFSHYEIRYLWNKHLSTLGYISEYQKEWSGLTFSQYCLKRGISKEKGVSGYQYGQKTQWLSPGTEQVISVKSERELSHYLSKYLSKQIAENEDEDRASVFGRVWARSTSISVLKYQNTLDVDFIKKINVLLKDVVKGLKKCYYDYCSVYYYNLKLLPSDIKIVINNYLFFNAKLYHYPFPV